MRRYQKWLTTLGVLALTPSLALAGPFSFGFGKKSEPAEPKASAADAPASRQSSNQRTAENVAEALRRANLSGYDIEIQFQSGKAVLSGEVASLQQKQTASAAVSAVPGVSSVDNRLTVAQPKASAAPAGRPAAPTAGARQPQQAQIQQAHAQQALVQQAAMQQAAAQQAAAQRQFAGAPQQAIRPVNFQEGEYPIPGPSPANVAPAPPGMHGAPGIAPGPFAGGVPSPPGTPMNGMVYDQPNLPNHAWPAYAAHPNYAAVTYPSQYSASAWPYIGPFYPYPQVPLGWRKAQLEWDDGYWQLNFRPRTERWWWFMDYRNW